MFKIADIALTTRCAKPASLREMFRSCYFFLFSGQKNRGSMDRVHRDGPWTGSTGVVQGPGSMFCIHPPSSDNLHTCMMCTVVQSDMNWN